MRGLALLATAAGAGVLALGGGAAAHDGAHADPASPAAGVVDAALPAYRPGSTLAESFAWQEAAPHPIERFEGNGLAAHGRLWVMGGFGRYTTQASPRSDVYDPATDTWTRIADMPVTVTHSPAVLVDDVIWFLGGFIGNHPGPSTSDVWKYDTSTDTWSPGPSLPAPRGAGGAALLDGRIHYFGGANRVTGSTGYPDQADQWALDLADQGAGWQPLADVPAKRNHLSGAALGGFVYAIGGQIGSEETGNQSRVDRYDPATDSWQSVADMPTARSHITASTFVVGGRIVVGGGTNNGNDETNDGDGVPSRDMASYDPATDTWEVLPPLPSGRKTPVMGAIGGRLVSSTGYGGTGTDTTWVSTTLPFDAPAEPRPPPPEPGPTPTADPPGGSGPQHQPGDATAGPSGSPPTMPGAEPTTGRDGSPARSGGKVELTVAQLRINQRIAQAAVRRVNALTALVEGRPAPPEKAAGGDGGLRLTKGQLLINQRISQAAVRRVNALQRRLDGLPPEPTAEGRSGDGVTLSARQILINQRISQAAVRRVNALADRVARDGFRTTALVRRAHASDCALCGPVSSAGAVSVRLVDGRWVVVRPGAPWT